MKVSYNWLKTYTNIDCSPEEISEILTSIGLEVEGFEKVESIKGGLEGVVIGKVLTCEKHPDADRLSVTTVDVGREEPLNIVCGAPNVAAGQKVPVATIGTKIWTSDTEYFEIKKSKIRGKLSEGMICAEDELGLGSSHDGIMVLSDNALVGSPAKEYFDLKEDHVIEIGITANRVDATSHIGVARDLVAGYNVLKHTDHKLIYPSVDGYKKDNDSLKIDIQVEDTDCPRYSGVVISGVSVKESPEWLQNYLKTIGLRPINNVVDITNFVLMEMGQPLHAFDADKIAGGKVIVKKLSKGTKFTTLDNIERELNGEELMICNTQEGMCIAGVMGGTKSGVNESTQNIFLESAYFNPVSIRKTSKFHTLKTDASFRYERGCDPDITIYALKRAALLIKELAGGNVSSEIIDIYPKRIERAEIELNFQCLCKLVGKEIDVFTIKQILEFLEIDIKNETRDGLTAIVPLNKVDVTREADLIEEILRIYGYNRIEIGDSVKSSLAYKTKPDRETLQNLVSDYLSSNGFNEIMNNSLTKTAYYEENNDFEKDHNVYIMNPLSKDLGMMRRTLLYGGLETIVHNINRKIPNQKLYEFGNIYEYCPENKENPSVIKRYKEEKMFSLWMTGNLTPESWKMASKPADIYNMKAFVESIFKRLRVDFWRFAVEPASYNFYAEGLEYINKDNKKVIARIGRISKKTLKDFDIKQEVFYAEFSWDLLLKSLPKKEVKYTEIAKFPEVRRDLSLIVEKTFEFKEIEKLAYETEKKYLKRVGLFDVYEG
ncbi:phenylalanine--tRNA ligase subunit beta, partial [Bacteroidales bacterium OttesenSCG-928-C19]|nr:phenylalanine--tRNA ligase subunit beta [Bacteroidales bacterium OttesenSCG-928-C19]